MRHKVFGRKLNRSTNERKRLFRNLIRSLILHGRIKTTLAKAKAIQPFIEKMISRARVNSLHNRRILLKKLPDKTAVDKLVKIIGPAFKDTKGGYTRIIKTTEREGDKGLQVIMSFTKEFFQQKKTKEKEEEQNKNKKTVKKNKKESKSKEKNAKDTINKEK